MTAKGRDRRAAKQRRRDERRGFRPGSVGAEGAGATDPGLPPETLRRVLRETADDVAAGRDEALTELRLLLTEHLARRREEILAACDEVLAGAGEPGVVRDGGSTEDAVVATVRRLARLT